MTATQPAEPKGAPLKWLITLALPVILYFLLPVDGQTMTQPMALFLAVTLFTVCVWATEILNDVAVGLMLPVLYMIICGVPQKVVYGPWTSQVPIIVIGGFTLGKILQHTGLGKRIGLTCVRAMGGSIKGAIWGMTIAVFIVAPLVPAITGKAAIFCAIAISLCEALEFKPKSREATIVLVGTFLAVASTKLCYLTGGADLVLGMGLADKVMGTKTAWMNYAMHNFLPGTLYTIMSIFLLIFLLPSKVKSTALKPTLDEKLRELGPITRDQKVAGLLMLFTLVMLATDKLHGINAGQLLIGVTFISFLPGVNLMDGKKFGQINFAPLFFIMGCMAIGSAGGFLKVTHLIAATALPYFHDLSLTSMGAASYLLGMLANFLLTPLAATTTLTSPLVELGVQMGVEPRIPYYAFQYGLDNYIFPYEYAVLLYFFSFGYISFIDMVKVLAARLVLTGLFIVFIAVPYWNWVL